MPIDRASTLRNAEKLLRQGRLEPAIAEYLRVVEDQPRDWNTANALGDLYVRVGRVDDAVVQFTRIADALRDEGFLSKASALYKKTLKLKPEHEHSLLQAAEVAAGQGLVADARAQLNALMELYLRRGDTKGIARVRVRLGGLDPADFEARLLGARALLDLDDARGAARAIGQLATEAAQKDRPLEGVALLREAAGLAPDDEGLRRQLRELCMANGDVALAVQYASSVSEFEAMADTLLSGGREDDALEVLRRAARAHPHDGLLGGRLARMFLGRGDAIAAAESLTVEQAGADAGLLLTVMEVRVRTGQLEEGVALAARVLASEPARRLEVEQLGISLAESWPDAGFGLTDLAARVASDAGDWPAAAAILRTYAERTHSIPALMRLVEVSVDGGLDAITDQAQAQLADAYLASGAAAEACVIAEDLVARAPSDPANIDRLRRALVMVGEADPEALIEERLSGASPFMNDDFSAAPDLSREALPAEDVVAAPTLDAIAAAAPRDVAVTDAHAGHSEAAPGPEARLGTEGQSEAGPAPGVESAPEAQRSIETPRAGDVETHPRGEWREGPTTEAAVAMEVIEIDLSRLLDELLNESPAQISLPPLAPIRVSAQEAADVDGMFAQIREEAGRRLALDSAEELYARGLALQQAGDVDGCIEALRAAARAPTLRFVAASLLGRVLRDRGALVEAVDWLERAAEAPAAAAEVNDVLYDLADVLTTLGELDRARAIYLELQTSTDGYRDVATRIERLEGR